VVTVRHQHMKSRILVIDDEAAIRDSLQMILEYEGYEVLTAATGEDGIAQAERAAPDLILLDVKMPGMDGLEVLQRLRHIVEVTPIVVISGHGTVSTAVEATKLGAFDFIEKPLERERILVTLRNAVDSRRLRTENRSFRRDAEKRYQIVGDSPLLARVRGAIARAAPTSATVLIWGESGVGKELVARAIHRESLRRDGPFVQVNCAAIPDELIESELFGHEKGSFTGATDRQIGKFEQADKGTIFLDEVGDMSLKTQAKVLRVLQEQELERLGSNRILKVDVRVIAATNKNLEEEISRGTFREDLFYRLNVIPVHVPALRDRRDDVPALVRHFADLFARENNFRRKTFTAAAMERLTQHHWRGNIRELRNFVERIIIMTPGDQIDVMDLPDFTGGRLPDAAPSPGRAATPLMQADVVPSGGADWMRAPTLQEFKSTSERAFLVNKLRDNNWNISKTAEVIDTPRSNLYKKLEQYQISQETDG
jgi:two-component system, NtrC family, nitrogen regulation response regulator NtrX